MDVTIRPLAEADVEEVVAVSLEAWAPVFASSVRIMGSRVFGLVYPDWRSGKARAVEQVCRSDRVDVWVADVDEQPVGFVAVRWTEEDATPIGEIEMIAVDPAHQRGGVGSRLLDRAMTEVGARGLPLAVIATGGDPGHAPARALYGRYGFTGLPLVRYYRAPLELTRVGTPAAALLLATRRASLSRRQGQPSTAETWPVLTTGPVSAALTATCDHLPASGA